MGSIVALLLATIPVQIPRNEKKRANQVANDLWLGVQKLRSEDQRRVIEGTIEGLIDERSELDKKINTHQQELANLNSRYQTDLPSLIKPPTGWAGIVDKVLGNSKTLDIDYVMNTGQTTIVDVDKE